MMLQSYKRYLLLVHNLSSVWRSNWFRHRIVDSPADITIVLPQQKQ